MNNLKLIRKMVGISQKELAEKLGVHVSLISKWEKGQRKPSSNQLFEISNIFGLSIDYIMNYKSNLNLKLRSKHKKKDGVIGKVLKDVNQLNHFVLKSYELLNQVPEKFSYYVQFSISNLENLCNEVRELFKLNRSISYLELKEALIEKNIHVFEWNLPMNISGISIRDELSIIIINYAHTTERKNFTLSHELAHILFHLNEKDSKVTVSDIQSQEKIEEKISNLFAAELLMPSSDFDKIVAAYSSEIDKTIFLDLIAKHFNVSREAVFYRLAEKKVLNWKDKSKYLKNIKMIEEIPSSLVTNIDEQISKKFLINALKLYSEEKISSGKLAEWFFVDRITLMDYLEKFYKPTTAEFLITTES